MASIIVRSPDPYGHIPAATAAIRLIGRRHVDAHRVCAPREVTWTGPSDECWSCGQPTLTAYTGPLTVLGADLLTRWAAAGRWGRRSPRPLTSWSARTAQRSSSPPA